MLMGFVLQAFYAGWFEEVWGCVVHEWGGVQGAGEHTGGGW